PNLAIAVPAVTPPVETESAWEGGFDVVTALLGLWLLGAVLYTTRQARRIARHTSVVRQAAPAVAPLTADIAAIAKQFGVRPPRTLLARDILAPFVWFFGRLRLVWPQRMTGGEQMAHLRGVIAHELAHIRRRDQ